MENNKRNRCLSFTSKILFKHIFPKFPTGPFKPLMDFSYIIYEKIAVNFEFLYINYINMYEELVKKEIDISNISSDDSVLVVGCGSIPTTSILLSKHSDARIIVSIDHDAKAVKKAKNLMKSFNFNKNLIFECADLLEYSIKEFDVVFLLYGIKKQKKIMKYVSKNLKNASRVIFRTTYDSLIKFLGGKEFIDRYFDINNSDKSEKFNDTISFLLKKK